MFQFKFSFDCNVKGLKYKPLFKLDFLDHKSLLFSRIVIDGKLVLVIGLLMSLVKKKELTVNCSVSPHVVQDMGEEFDFGTKSVPPERRRKSTVAIILN